MSGYDRRQVLKGLGIGAGAGLALLCLAVVGFLVVMNARGEARAMLAMREPVAGTVATAAKSETSIVGTWLYVGRPGSGMIFRADGTFGATDPVHLIAGKWKEIAPGQIELDITHGIPQESTGVFTYRFDGATLIWDGKDRLTRKP